MRTITEPFSLKGLDDFSKKINTLIKKQNVLEQMFIKESLSFIRKQAIHYINETTGGSEWYQVTSELANSFAMDLSIKRLFNSCYYSAYVEFGTGIKGESRDGYVSDASGKGEEGWFFRTEDGELHFTHGMPAHRFMFNAINDYVVGNEYQKIFSRCFNKILGGVV